jgi:hypothetical protein
MSWTGRAWNLVQRALGEVDMSSQRAVGAVLVRNAELRRLWRLEEWLLSRRIARRYE